MTRQVPLAKPMLGAEEEVAVCTVLRSGWVSQGPKVDEFEKGLESYLGSSHVRAVNSGTSALMLALRALGVGSGDSVIVPAFGCAATPLAVLETGAKSVFVDVDPYTSNTDWNFVHGAIDANTKAIIVPHMFGRSAPIERIATECKQRNLVLIEDVALSLGARIGEAFAGTIGNAGCLSFHPRKMITTGEGGAVCTADSRVAGQIASDRSYGAAQSAWNRHQIGDGSPQGFTRLGFNLKMTDLQAAVGLMQLNRLQNMIDRRRCIAEFYRSELSGCHGILWPESPKAVEEHVYQAWIGLWHPAAFADGGARINEVDNAHESLKRFRERLRLRGVASSDAAQFIPELPVFNQEDLREVCFNSFKLARLAFALPIYPSMTDDDVQWVVQCVRESLNEIKDEETKGHKD